MKMKLAATALLSVLAISASASAQSPTPVPCKGGVVIDTVYQKGTNSRFEYYIQLRNAGNTKIAAKVDFGSFPKEVILFSRSLTNIILDPHQNKQIRFGSGSSSQINDGTVKKYYDHAMSLPSPYVLAHDCSR